MKVNQHRSLSLVFLFLINKHILSFFYFSFKLNKDFYKSYFFALPIVSYQTLIINCICTAFKYIYIYKKSKIKHPFLSIFLNVRPLTNHSILNLKHRSLNYLTLALKCLKEAFTTFWNWINNENIISS